MLSSTEENYLKAIYKLSEKTADAVSTNAIAARMETSAASVTDMIKRLSEKELVHYEKYKGVRLTENGKQKATLLIRKHRLWETFLVEKLNFSWDEVHPMAEELEHIQSDELVNRLDAFLGNPKFDPHGDPIPDREGNIASNNHIPLAELAFGGRAVIVGVKDHTPAFLRYVEQLRLVLGTRIAIIEKFEYDQSIRLLVDDTQEVVITQKVSNNLFVKPE